MLTRKNLSVTITDNPDLPTKIVRTAVKLSTITECPPPLVISGDSLMRQMVQDQVQKLLHAVYGEILKDLEELKEKQERQWLRELGNPESGRELRLLEGPEITHGIVRLMSKIKTAFQ